VRAILTYKIDTPKEQFVEVSKNLAKYRSENNFVGLLLYRK